MNLRTLPTSQERNATLETELGVHLSAIRETLKDEEKNIHCENCIGAVGIPVGVAGPLIIHSDTHERRVHIPLATTEGALVASVNRGCRALSSAGGVQVLTEHIGVTRGPVFQVQGIRSGKALCDWLDSHLSDLGEVAASTSQHLKLLRIFSKHQGRYVYVRFQFDTDQAMGMNMATIATQALCTYIEEKTKAHTVSVAGNFDTDKKPSYLNMLLGRGRSVWAEGVVPEKIVQEMLHVSPSQVRDMVVQKCWGGSVMAGSVGHNAHFANIVAAFYAATGQDIAHVSESSVGITSAEVLENGSLYFSVYLPDVMIGWVGGGTGLLAQTEAKKLTGSSNADELTQVLGGAVLAGELSLIASLAQGTLAQTHARLGR